VLRRGDVAIVRGPDPYTVADDPATPPQAIILPGQRCTTPDGQEVELMHDLGVRTWGNATDGETVMLTGTYELHSEVSGRLLRALPTSLVLRDDEWDCPVIPLLADEIVKDEPGQESVLDRLLDLLLIAVLRAWFARPEARAPGWYRASGDPVVGHALRLLHHDPARQWTVAELAREAGVSRAALARRFHALVGEPPMTFLTGWRIALAADLLREPGATIASVADQVGYGTPFALSAAFKRLRGVSPARYRAAAGRPPATSTAAG
jgi:AraC-like DNA-binding protein